MPSDGHLMAFETIEGVELVTAGIEWQASTGPITVAFEHLRDMMVAANEDPHVQSPRVKIGHGVQLCGDLGDHDPYWDGEPAFGSVVDLRLENDGAVLVGDLVGVPAWLAEAMASAYPTRSCEFQGPITTPGGKHYLAVLTACAVGSWQPAIADLEDLQILIEEGPDALVAASAATERSSMDRPSPTTEASVDTGVIRQRFNFEWAMDPENVFEDTDGKVIDPWWWWARSVRVDPLEIIADDDDGGLWRVPFSTDGADEVTFGDPVRVREEFVDLAASLREDVQLTQRVLATYTDRPAKPRPQTAASRSDNDNPPEEGHMGIDMDALRERLGLPEDATDEQINEALAAEEQGTEPEAPEPEEAEEAEETPAAEEPEPVAASALPDGMVAVPAEKWAEVQAGAKAGNDLSVAAEDKRRDETIEAALSAGKVPPRDRDSLVNMHASNREGFYRLLTADVSDGGLAPGLVPVTEDGTAADAEALTNHDQIMAAAFGVQKEKS